MDVRAIASRVTQAAAVLLVAVAALAGDEPKRTGTSHPRFDDKGTLSWSTKLADAQAAASASGRFIFIDYGRES